MSENGEISGGWSATTTLSHKEWSIVCDPVKSYTVTQFAKWHYSHSAGTARQAPPLPPLGHIGDVMLVRRKGNIETKLSLWYSIVCYYNGAQRYEQFFKVGWLYRVLILLGLALLSSECFCIFSLHGAIYRLTFFYLLVSWAWWDWPSTQLTNHCPSVLWHCWLGHLTRKIISEMTCNVSSGTLNPTIPIPARPAGNGQMVNRNSMLNFVKEVFIFVCRTVKWILTVDVVNTGLYWLGTK